VWSVLLVTDEAPWSIDVLAQVSLLASIAGPVRFPQRVWVTRDPLNHQRRVRCD
jgi:hypothetical protein